MIFYPPVHAGIDAGAILKLFSHALGNVLTWAVGAQQRRGAARRRFALLFAAGRPRSAQAPQGLQGLCGGRLVVRVFPRTTKIDKTFQ